MTCHQCPPGRYCDGCLAETKRTSLAVARTLGQAWAEEWTRNRVTKETMDAAADACARTRLRSAFRDERAWNIEHVQAFCAAADQWWKRRPERYRVAPGL